MSKTTDDDNMALHFINTCNNSHNSHIFYLIIKELYSKNLSYMIYFLNYS